MTAPNLCFDLLDLPVVRGRAEETALVPASGPTVDLAGLLELVAAVGGVVRGLGATPGSRVVVALDDPADELVAVLAAVRVGAVPVLPDTRGDAGDLADLVATHRPAVGLASRVPAYASGAPGAWVLRGPEPRDPEHEVAWDVALRAGRTDPAAVHEPVAGAPLVVAPDDAPVRARLDDLAAGRPVVLPAGPAVP